jgi:hypothetical protein
MEHALSYNFKLAVDFLRDAENAEQSNPIVNHEQATVAYMQGDFTGISFSFRRKLNSLYFQLPNKSIEKQFVKYARQLLARISRQPYLDRAVTSGNLCSRTWD